MASPRRDAPWVEGRRAAPGELDAHLEPIRVSASRRCAPAHTPVVDRRGVDCSCTTPARADDHARPRCAALSGDDRACHPEHDGTDRAHRLADRLHSHAQPPQRRQRADRHDRRRHADLVAAQTVGAAGAIDGARCVQRQPFRGSVGAAQAQRAGDPGAHRSDGADHSTLALHLARGQAHRAHPRPRDQRRAARADDARCPRPQANRHLSGRARPRSSLSIVMRWTPTSSSSAAIK
jgi:hypothetical protein